MFGLFSRPCESLQPGVTFVTPLRMDVIKKNNLVSKIPNKIYCVDLNFWYGNTEEKFGCISSKKDWFLTDLDFKEYAECLDENDVVESSKSNTLASHGISVPLIKMGINAFQYDSTLDHEGRENKLEEYLLSLVHGLRYRDGLPQKDMADAIITAEAFTYGLDFTSEEVKKYVNNVDLAQHIYENAGFSDYNSSGFQSWIGFCNFIGGFGSSGTKSPSDWIWNQKRLALDSAENYLNDDYANYKVGMLCSLLGMHCEPDN